MQLTFVVFVFEYPILVTLRLVLARELWKTRAVAHIEHIVLCGRETENPLGGGSERMNMADLPPAVTGSIKPSSATAATTNKPTRISFFIRNELCVSTNLFFSCRGRALRTPHGLRGWGFQVLVRRLRKGGGGGSPGPRRIASSLSAYRALAVGSWTCALCRYRYLDLEL
jgi:hypothetical protein